MAWRTILVLMMTVLTLGAQEAPPVKALVLHGRHFKLAEQVAADYAAAGIALTFQSLEKPVSAEQLQLFHAVILPDFVGLGVPTFVPRDIVIGWLNARENLARIETYVAAGGGLFISPLMTGGGEEVAESVNDLIGPHGAELMALQVRDEANAGHDGVYAWTDRVADSPAVAGVTGLWYPTNMLRWDDAYATPVLRLHDPAWTALVRPMASATAARGYQYTEWEPVATDADGAPIAPVLAAMRPVGQGRMALLAVGPFFTFTHAYATPKNGWVGESKTGPIEGIFLKPGEGPQRSEGQRLLVGMIRWLGESGRAAGFGGDQALADLPAPPAEAIPQWLNWTANGGGASPQKVLLGVRTRYSDGQGSLAECAAAARAAGYGVMIVTETFEHLDAPAWNALVKECRQLSDAALAIMPGIDIADVYQNRYLVFGQRSYPGRFMLDDEGRRLVKTQYLSLGFGTHFTAIHRATTTPLPDRLHKFFTGWVVYTYREGTLVDNSFPGYQWQVNNTSNPMPLLVHEVYSPAEVAAAANAERQLWAMLDTPEHAAWYLRGGMNHFWESPTLVAISGGPTIRALSNRSAEIVSERPLKEVTLISDYRAQRRWLPASGATTLTVDWALPPGQLHNGILRVVDVDGREAITPGLRLSDPGVRYTWRCSDRQNWFGWAMNYTGTILPDVNPVVPAPMTDEGNGLWPHQGGERRGENLAPLLELAHAGTAVYVTDAQLDQRYWRANWLDVAFDGKPANGTAPSRVYQGRMRYYDFGLSEEWRKNDRARPMMLKELSLSLRLPIEPNGPVFPWFQRFAGNAILRQGDDESPVGKLPEAWVDLRPGDAVDTLIVLSPGLRLSRDGRLGFAVDWPPNGPLPTATAWQARWVRAPAADQVAPLRRAMGLTAEPPGYALNLSRGRLTELAYVARLEASDGGVAGEVVPAEAMSYPLPLFIAGLRDGWPVGVWREGQDDLAPFSLFEQIGRARLDVTRGGRFYAGHLVTAADPWLRLTIVDWRADRLRLRLHNPTDRPIATTVSTPPEIAGRWPVTAAPVEVPAGTTVTVEFRGGLR